LVQPTLGEACHFIDLLRFLAGTPILRADRVRSFNQASMMQINHHGAIDGVTGSCHELVLADGRSLLIDCGL
jgi:hypothetical protein